MARKTVTTYTCDGCEQTVERPRDLKKFTIAGQSNNRNRWRNAPVTEVCDDCELKLIEALKPFMPESQLENLLELRREAAHA